jgi:hypothetical protein
MRAIRSHVHRRYKQGRQFSVAVSGGVTDQRAMPTTQPTEQFLETSFIAMRVRRMKRASECLCFWRRRCATSYNYVDVEKRTVCTEKWPMQGTLRRQDFAKAFWVGAPGSVSATDLAIESTRPQHSLAVVRGFAFRRLAGFSMARYYVAPVL